MLGGSVVLAGWCEVIHVHVLMIARLALTSHGGAVSLSLTQWVEQDAAGLVAPHTECPC